MLKKTLIVFLSLICFYFVISIPDSVAVKVPNSLLVASSNFLYSNSDELSFLSQIKKLDVDILLITEYKASLEKYLLKLGFVKLASKDERGTHSIALFTKSNYKGKASVLYPKKISPCTMPYIAAKLKFEDKIVNFLGVHLPPPLPRCKFMTNESFASIFDYVDRFDFNKEFTIIAGDFNSFSFSDGISEMNKRNWVDSYTESNFFPGPTWSPFSFLPAFFRIDYIFTNHKEKIMDSYSVSVDGSDHRMVITDFKY